MTLTTNKYLVKTLLLVFITGYILLIALIFQSLFKLQNFTLSTDVISFLTGAKIIREGKVNFIYDIQTQHYYQNLVVSPYEKKMLLPFRNFPLVAVFYIPFLQTNLVDAYKIIFVVNILLLLTFHRDFKIYFPKLKKYKYLFFLPLIFYPSISNLIVGQYTPLVLLLFLFIYIFIKKEKSLLVGFLTSLLLIKSQYLLFSPFLYILVKDKKRYFLGFIIGFLLFMALNVLIAGSLRPFMNYPDFILMTESPLYGSRPFQMYTLYGLIKSVFQSVKTSYLISINLLIYVATCVLVFTRRKIFSKLRFNDLFTIGILCTILFSVHALTHDLMLFLIPIYLYLVSGKKEDLIKAGYIFVMTGVFSLAAVGFATTVLMIILLIFLILDLKIPLKFLNSKV